MGEPPSHLPAGDNEPKKKKKRVSAVSKVSPSQRRELGVFLALNLCDFEANLPSRSPVPRRGGAGQPPASLGYLLPPELPSEELCELRGNLRLFSASTCWAFSFFFFLPP